MFEEVKEDNVSASSADKFAELEKKADEYLNNWKRAVADLINYKKEEAERAGVLVKYAKEDTFYNLLPIIDSIYMAATAFGNSGFEPVKKQIEEFLKKEGIEEIAATGQEFNAGTMEIVEEAEGKEPGIVVEELQKGYKIGEKVLRPAKVRVSK